MKKLLLFLVTSSAFAQAVRFDPFPASTVSGNTPSGAYSPILAVPGATVSVSTTTYTDSTGAFSCPVNKPITLSGSASCVSTSDAQGRFGFWVNPGTYTYTIVFPNGQVKGPYFFTAGGSGSGSSGVTSFNARTGDVSPIVGDYASFYAPITGINAASIADGSVTNAEFQYIDTLRSNVQDQIDALAASITAATTAPGISFTQTDSAYTSNVQEQLVFTVTPQQFGAKGDGINDDSGAIDAAIRYLAGLSNSYTKKLSLYGSYYLPTSNYQVSLPYDFGDYSNTFTGSGAAVTLSVANGQLTGCLVSGGGSYTFNSTLQVQIIDPSRRGTGGHATVATNGSGVPTSCTIVTAGINYPSTGLQTTVLPIGGDGASATAAMTSGVLATGASTLIGGGSGYTTSINITNGLQCSTYPTFTTTVSGTVITAVTVTTGGSGCTLGGNATTTVPLLIGDGCSGAQCTNLAPETPTLLGCAVALRSGISYEGLGQATFKTDWTNNSSVVNTSQRIALCDPWGDQGAGITLKNISINGLFNVWFSGALTNSTFDNVSLNGGLGLFAAYTGGTGQGNNLATTNNQFTDINVNAFGGFVFGGTWVRRNGMQGSGSGSIGGTDAHNGGSYLDGGTSSGVVMNNVSSTTTGQAQNAALDTLMETYVWKFQNGPAALRFSIFGQSQCYGTQTVVDRSTDFWGGTNNGTFSSLWPWATCYYGNSGSLVVANNRWTASNSNSQFTNMHQQTQPIRRPILYGNWIASYFSNVVSTGSTGTVWADPYTNSAAEPGFITLINAGNGGIGGSQFSNVQVSIGTPFTTLVNHQSRISTDQTILDTYLGGMTAVGGSPNIKFPSGKVVYGSGIGATGVSITTQATVPTGTCVNGSITIYTAGTGAQYNCVSTAWVLK